MSKTGKKVVRGEYSTRREEKKKEKKNTIRIRKLAVMVRVRHTNHIHGVKLERAKRKK